MRREPSVLLAEITWRWLFGGIATALLVWATLVFLQAIEVSKANQFLLRTLNPAILSYGLRDMFAQKWGLLARLGLIVTVSLSFLWMVTATIARAATTRVLVERIAESHGEAREARSNLRTVAAIQFIRVALLWFGAAAYVLIAIASGAITSTAGKPHTGAFLLLFFFLFGIVAVVLSFFNWILLLAPICAIRDALPFSDSVLSAWHLTRNRRGSLTGLNLAHFALRLIWFVFISGIAFVPLGFVHLLPKMVILAAILATTLIYCAVADALFVARYAGYIEIAEQESHPDTEPEFAPAYMGPNAIEPVLTEPPVPPETPAI
jgi:hypothetical protein